MCYSALAEQNVKRLTRRGEACVDVEMFEDRVHRRAAGEGIKLAKSLEANFLAPGSAAGRRIADAERTLAQRTDKKRIAGNKIEWLLAKLADLRRAERKPDDRRIFPFWHTPVPVEMDGEHLIRPMRYRLYMHAAIALLLASVHLSALAGSPGNICGPLPPEAQNREVAWITESELTATAVTKAVSSLEAARDPSWGGGHHDHLVIGNLRIIEGYALKYRAEHYRSAETMNTFCKWLFTQAHWPE
jgi:hypothetical protein